MPKLVDLDQIKTMLRVTNSHIPSILDLVHVKSGTVHYLTNPTLPSKVEGVGIFTASSDYTAGDTVQINGTTYAVKTMNGTNPPTGMFKSGATVVVGINYQSKSITFKVDGGAGGVDAVGLKLATASVGDVLSGKTFYSGDNSLKTGNMSVQKYRVKSGTFGFPIDRIAIVECGFYINSIILYGSQGSASCIYVYTGSTQLGLAYVDGTGAPASNAINDRRTAFDVNARLSGFLSTNYFTNMIISYYVTGTD